MDPGNGSDGMTMYVIPVAVCRGCGGRFLAVAFIAARVRGYCSAKCESATLELFGPAPSKILELCPEVSSSDIGRPAG